MTIGLALLRATGTAALLVLLWNPATTHPAADPRPLVLLDASLSMAGHGGHWREAVDTARALARGGPIWRFGASLQPFDTVPPTDGQTTLEPALVAAASRGGPVAVVTDGAVDDVEGIAPDLLERPRVVLVPRQEFRDYFVGGVTGPHRIEATDTLRLAVLCGTAGPRGLAQSATVVARLAARRLAVQSVVLPESGSVAVQVVVPAAALPGGWSVLDIRLEGVSDSEPRDDGRLFVVEVSAAPTTVVLAAPPDWDSRFLGRTLAAVGGGRIRTLVEIRRGASETAWVDGTTLAPVSTDAVRRAIREAALVAVIGDPTLGGPITASAILRVLPPAAAGDWYLDPPLPSPLTSALAGVAWDSLPPLFAISPVAESGAVVLTARVARRGPAEPVVVLLERGGVREVVIGGAGLYRWAFRGGASGDAYRTLVAALTDWLLAVRTSQSARATPVTLESLNGLPLAWRWNGAGAPRDLGIRLRGSTGERRDTLRFGPDGQATLRLPPGVYSYELDGGPERGLVAVDTASTEWPPRPPMIRAQPGRDAERTDTVTARDRGGLFALALVAFAAEWAWRRRAGLP